jgi:hypothetical protein
MAPTVCGKLDGFGYVYAILNRAHKRGIYIVWTSQSLAAKKNEHAYGNCRLYKERAELKLQKDLKQHGSHNFVIVGLEIVSSTETAGLRMLHAKREQFWQSKVQSLQHAYNSIRVIAKRSSNRSTSVRLPLIRLFGQRHYILKLQHLVNYYTNLNCVISDEFFDGFLTSKLTAYISILSYH